VSSNPSIAHVHDIRIAYDDTGTATGIPLVLIHPFPANRRAWDPQRTELSAHCRVITPDLRGFGESSVSGPYSMDQYADDIAALLTTLGITGSTRAIIGGLSMGGYVALALWRRHRERIRALILADTRATADTDDTRTKRQQLAEVARTHGSAAVADRQLTGLLGATTREHRPDLVQHVRDLLVTAPADGIIGALHAMATRPDATPLLDSIDVPTLCIVGDEDVITPVKEMRTLHAALPHSTLHIIERAGHLSNVERADAFNSAIVDFIRTI